MERMTESCHATVDHFGKQISFVNVMKNMSVSCDFEGAGSKSIIISRIRQKKHGALAFFARHVFFVGFVCDIGKLISVQLSSFRGQRSRLVPLFQLQRNSRSGTGQKSVRQV